MSLKVGIVREKVKVIIKQYLIDHDINITVIFIAVYNYYDKKRHLLNTIKIYFEIMKLQKWRRKKITGSKMQFNVLH